MKTIEFIISWGLVAALIGLTVVAAGWIAAVLLWTVPVYRIIKK